MVAYRNLAGLIGKRRAAATTMVGAALAASLLATEIPTALLPASGGSAALAELLARSPGMRVGGVALKAKEKRFAAAPVAGAAPPASDVAAPATNPVATVLGAAAGPEGPVPGSTAPGVFPADFGAPAIPGAITSPADAAVPAAPGFATVPLPSSGGVPIIVFPGGGGGGGGGGGESGTEPNPSEPPVNPPPGPPVIPGVPEPSTWLMLIAGFGTIGTTMRRRRRGAFA